MLTLAEQLFSLAPAIKYVAVVRDADVVEMQMRPGTPPSSSPVTDHFEEQAVNPAILAVAHGRGRLDLGGCEYVLIKYGPIYAHVIRTRRGHVTVSYAATDEPLRYYSGVRRLLQEAGEL
jgi:hypothetical protein